MVANNENGAGVSATEVTARTFSDAPSDVPQNFTLETASSTVSELLYYKEQRIMLLFCVIWIDNVVFAGSALNHITRITDHIIPSPICHVIDCLK